MSTITTVNNHPMPSPTALELLQRSALRIRSPICAQRLWERHLTALDHARFDGDLDSAYRTYGTAGIWARLRGVTPERAVIDVAKRLGFLRDANYEWLRREIGESVDVDEAIDEAIASGALVLIERPREAFWNGEKIEIDWDRYSARWEFLWELGRHAKEGKPIDRLTFSEKKKTRVVADRKSRLVNMSEFPVDLSDRIDVVGRGTQRLELPPEQIRIFQVSDSDTLGEWYPGLA